MMASRHELDELLSAQHFGADLDAAQRGRLLAHARQRRLPAETHLFRQGDKAAAFYFVLEGRIKLYRLSPDGDERIIGLAQSRESFAEGILFMDPPRYPVNAQALLDTTVVALDRDAFLEILAASFPTCRAMLERMTRRIQGMLDQIESLALQNSRERLVHFLLGLVPEGATGEIAIDLPARKNEIAARLSIQPETLSRLFRIMDGEGLVRMQGERIEIPDIDALRAIVGLSSTRTNTRSRPT